MSLDAARKEDDFAKTMRDIKSRLRFIPGKRFGQWRYEWHVSHGMMGASGWTFTERGARRKMARAVREAERRRDDYLTRDDGWVSL